jgi:hypothetical protein
LAQPDCCVFPRLTKVGRGQYPHMDSPPLSANERLRGQRAALRANLCFDIERFIIIGPMAMLFASEVLHADAARIGLFGLASLTALAQIPLLDATRRRGQVRTLEYAVVAGLILLGAMILLPARWFGFWGFLAFVMLFRFMREAGVAAVWQPLLCDLTTTADRGAFFARMRGAFMGVSMIASIAIVSCIGDEMSENAYKLLLGALGVGLLNQWYWCRRIPERRQYQPADRWLPRVLRVARTSPLLRLPTLACTLMFLADFPVLVVYLRGMMHIPVDLLALQACAMTIGALGAYFTWGKMVDRIGIRRTSVRLACSAVAIAPLALALAPLPEGATWATFGAREGITVTAMLLLGVALGGANAGFGILITAIQHGHAGREALEALTLSSLLSRIAVAIAFLLSGLFLHHVAEPCGSLTVVGGWLHLDWVKAWLALGIPGLYVLSTLCVLRLPEPHDGAGATNRSNSEPPADTPVASPAA